MEANKLLYPLATISEDNKFFETFTKAEPWQRVAGLVCGSGHTTEFMALKSKLVSALLAASRFFNTVFAERFKVEIWLFAQNRFSKLGLFITTSSPTSLLLEILRKVSPELLLTSICVNLFPEAVKLFKAVLLLKSRV